MVSKDLFLRIILVEDVCASCRYLRCLLASCLPIYVLLSTLPSSISLPSSFNPSFLYFSPFFILLFPLFLPFFLCSIIPIPPLFVLPFLPLLPSLPPSFVAIFLYSFVQFFFLFLSLVGEESVGIVILLSTRGCDVLEISCCLRNTWSPRLFSSRKEKYGTKNSGPQGRYLHFIIMIFSKF